MADGYQLETTTDRLLLEDGSGIYLLQSSEIVPPPPEQPVPVYPRPADQPRHVEAGWMQTVVDATRPVLPPWDTPPLPVALMLAPQTLFDASAPANAQPAPASFIPQVDVPPLPPRPWTAAQPSPEGAWLAGIVADFPLPIGPQPLPARPWIAGQPIATASWISVVRSDFAFTPWPQPLARTPLTSSDRARALAAWAQLLEGGSFVPRGTLLVLPIGLATATQPLFDASAIADQGQPPIALILPRSWPQPPASRPPTSPDRSPRISFTESFPFAQRIVRLPAAPWIPAATAGDAAVIADQGQPGVVVPFRAWPQLAAGRLFIPLASRSGLGWILRVGLGTVFLSDETALRALLSDETAYRALMSDDLADLAQLLTDLGYRVLVSDDAAYRATLRDDEEAN